MIPSANSPMGASALTANPSVIANPKVLTVHQVDNGFFCSLTKVDSYGQDMKIAPTQDDLNKIISEYFN